MRISLGHELPGHKTLAEKIVPKNENGRSFFLKGTVKGPSYAPYKASQGASWHPKSDSHR